MPLQTIINKMPTPESDGSGESSPAAASPTAAEGPQPPTPAAVSPPQKQARKRSANPAPTKASASKKGTTQDGGENGLKDSSEVASLRGGHSKDTTLPMPKKTADILNAIIQHVSQISAKQDASHSEVLEHFKTGNTATEELQAAISEVHLQVTDGVGRVLKATENLDHTIVSAHEELVSSLETSSIAICNTANAFPEVDKPVCENVRARHVLDSMTAAVTDGWLIRDKSHIMVTGDMEQKHDFDWRIKTGPKKALDYILQEIDKTGGACLSRPLPDGHPAKRFHTSARYRTNCFPGWRFKDGYEAEL
ncbi:hypothetical protein DFJ77DRAFT_440018 [Powellomyces hirtus]|nr:hypothetical protein DFJ77DRAFT_440018 [Powellomyces hirtus]